MENKGVIIDDNSYIMKLTDKHYVVKNGFNSRQDIVLSELIYEAQLFNGNKIDTLKHISKKMGAKIYRLKYILEPIEDEQNQCSTTEK